MKNSSFYNIPSAIGIALGLQDTRASQLASQQIEAHRAEPDVHHVFHVHSNASQTAHYAHTNEVLASQQAIMGNMTKKQALADPKLTKERERLIQQTHIVSTGGPPTHTDVPDKNRQTLVRLQDIVPQFFTSSLYNGKVTWPNLQTFGPPPPEVPDMTEFASMESDEIGAKLIGATIKGVQEHSYNKMYKEQAQQTTKRVVGSINAPVRVHVGEGVFGTDEGAKKRAKDVEEAVRS